MRKPLLASLALAAFLGHPAVANADEIARDTTRLGALMAVDALTTRSLTRRGAEEENPIARPFVRSDGGTLVYFAGSVLLDNLIARALPARARRGFLHGLFSVEIICVGNNLTRHAAPGGFLPAAALPLSRRPL